MTNDALRVSLLGDITDSATWTATAEQIEAIGADLGLDAKVGGKLLLYQSMNEYVVDLFVRSVLIALVLISALLVCFFRSWQARG